MTRINDASLSNGRPGTEAGLRTYTVVGTAAALFLLISKYGFMDVW
jgi:uncharacterized membrane protein YhiD involved in acid resistance